VHWKFLPLILAFNIQFEKAAILITLWIKFLNPLKRNFVGFSSHRKGRNELPTKRGSYIDRDSVLIV
jgi:hypothetical protein